jgi:MFS family permease
LKSFLGGIAEAFEDRNFRRYSVGSVVSWLSFFVQAVAVSWTTWDLTHSTWWLAIVALVDAAPNIAFMPLGGVIADRYDRFRILLVSYAFATLQAAVLAGLAFAGALTIVPLTALVFLNGLIHAFSIPAQFGFLPRFVEQRRLSSAIGVAAAYTQLGLFAGPALAGWVILHYGTAVAFATNVVGYGVFFGCVALLRTPAGYEQPVRSGKAFVADFLEGLRAIMNHRGITAILALMLFGDALASAVRQMAPAFADKGLGAGVEGLSVLLACGGIGATLSALWLAQGGASRASPGIIMSSFLGFLLGIVGLMLSHSLVLAGLGMIAVGCFYEICRTGTVALLQSRYLMLCVAGS